MTSSEAVGSGPTPITSSSGAGRVLVRDLARYDGREVTLQGWILTRRDLGGVRFLVLRDRSGVAQVVLSGIEVPLHESAVRVTGTVVAHAKAPGGYEVRASALETVSEATAPPPVLKRFLPLLPTSILLLVFDVDL